VGARHANRHEKRWKNRHRGPRPCYGSISPASPAFCKLSSRRHIEHRDRQARVGREARRRAVTSSIARPPTLRGCAQTLPRRPRAACRASPRRGTRKAATIVRREVCRRPRDYHCATNWCQAREREMKVEEEHVSDETAPLRNVSRRGGRLCVPSNHANISVCHAAHDAFRCTQSYTTTSPSRRNRPRHGRAAGPIPVLNLDHIPTVHSQVMAECTLAVQAHACCKTLCMDGAVLLPSRIKRGARSHFSRRVSPSG